MRLCKLARRAIDERADIGDAESSDEGSDDDTDEENQADRNMHYNDGEVSFQLQSDEGPISNDNGEHDTDNPHAHHANNADEIHQTSSSDSPSGESGSSSEDELALRPRPCSKAQPPPHRQDSRKRRSAVQQSSSSSKKKKTPSVSNKENGKKVRYVNRVGCVGLNRQSTTPKVTTEKSSQRYFQPTAINNSILFLHTDNLCNTGRA